MKSNNFTNKYSPVLSISCSRDDKFSRYDLQIYKRNLIFNNCFNKLSPVETWSSTEHKWRYKTKKKVSFEKSVILATSNMCRQDLQEQQQAKGKTYVSIVELLPVKKGNKDRMNY